MKFQYDDSDNNTTGATSILNIPIGPPPFPYQCICGNQPYLDGDLVGKWYPLPAPNIFYIIGAEATPRILLKLRKYNPVRR